MSTTKDIGRSLVAGFTAEILTAPLSTLKTVYQSQTKIGELSGKQIFINRWNSHGIAGLYAGGLFGIIRQMISTSSKYTFYQVVKRFNGTDDSNIANNLMNGVIGGVFAATLCQPVEVVHNFRQRGEPIMSRLFEQPKILLRGYPHALVRAILVTSCAFPIYDYLSILLPNDLKLLKIPIATLTTTLVVHPADLMMVRKMSGAPLFMGWNPINYYRGSQYGVLRALPHFWITMTTIESLKKMGM